MTVQKLLESLSSRELTEWYAFYRAGAEDQVRADLRSAAIASLEKRTRRKRLRK